MITKKYFHQKKIEMGIVEQDAVTLKYKIISQYQLFFDTLLSMLNHSSVQHNFPVGQQIVSLERGMHSLDGEPIFFDYFTTHNQYCDAHNISSNNMDHIYKIGFSDGQQIVFSTKPFETNQNILFLDSFYKQLSDSQKKQLDIIMHELVGYEYSYFHKLPEKANIVDTTNKNLKEIL